MKVFFDGIRGLTGGLSQTQVDGFNALLKATEALPLKHQAYVLATAWHETARTMQPIYERGARSYFDKYEPGTKLGKALGNTLKGDGYRFRGVGYVQLTGRANFVKMGKLLGHDLAAGPELAAMPDIAARIIVEGMTRGMFTGKKMADYADYVGMRRVVNGTDRAALISGHAVIFERALLAGARDALQPVPTAPAPTPQPVPPSQPAPIPAKPVLTLGRVMAAVVALILAAAGYFFKNGG